MNTVTKEHIESRIKHVSYHVIEGTTTTVCNITVENGFSVTGTSSCVDPMYFSKKAGEQYAYDEAFSKLWELEGYLLKEKLYREGNNG